MLGTMKNPRVSKGCSSHHDRSDACHLKKAKREISNYTFEYNVQNLIQLDKTIKQLENIKTGINADSFSVEGVKSTGEIEGARLSR